MIQSGLIPNAHDDLVTDASYDYYGLRLATCSLDQRIKVWKLNETDGSWSVEDEWKAHDAPVSKLSWAHPEFGTILASSSFDRTVKIWEQTTPIISHQALVNGASPQQSISRWVERAMLPDAKAGVRAVEFAPHQLGLKLATISSDNHLRIYECLEPSTLTSWQLTEEVDVTTLPTTPSHSYFSRTDTVALATPTQTNATLDSTTATQVAQALQHNLQQGNAQTRPGVGIREADGGWCVSWCKDRYWGEVIAAACGISGIVKVIQITPSRRPVTILALDPSPSSETSTNPTTTAPPQSLAITTPSSTATNETLPAAPSANQPSSGNTGLSLPSAPSPTPTGPGGTSLMTFAISSISWAPSCGRSYHLIATGGRDGHVRIWRIRPAPEEDCNISYYDDAGKGDGESDERDGKWTASIVADFDHHRSAVGRVEWNITGTVLSSAGNDGRIRLWKATAGNVWRPAGSIGVEQDDERESHNVDME
ncbi:hypothetical protein AMATHDRAFT_77541 [Amanita thiersii Skay4041]|uniref:Anaphase-promoting complex subunit 4 WD40 domain-containing protein n=1 Tax=Amanita thiersii Skay4041 TaxID=703135 RepID=A0A2A9N7Z5_9AGAR|nr:hypothetical protein AMATHDRAFT_77541 [Amanita thiersii Skay4041]